MGENLQSVGVNGGGELVRMVYEVFALLRHREANPNEIETFKY